MQGGRENVNKYKRIHFNLSTAKTAHRFHPVSQDTYLQSTFGVFQCNHKILPVHAKIIIFLNRFDLS